jgi:hypothetical protein
MTLVGGWEVKAVSEEKGTAEVTETAEWDLEAAAAAESAGDEEEARGGDGYTAAMEEASSCRSFGQTHQCLDRCPPPAPAAAA